MQLSCTLCKYSLTQLQPNQSSASSKFKSASLSRHYHPGSGGGGGKSAVKESCLRSTNISRAILLVQTNHALALTTGSYLCNVEASYCSGVEHNDGRVKERWNLIANWHIQPSYIVILYFCWMTLCLARVTTQQCILFFVGRSPHEPINPSSLLPSVT